MQLSGKQNCFAELFLPTIAARCKSAVCNVAQYNVGFCNGAYAMLPSAMLPYATLLCAMLPYDTGTVKEVCRTTFTPGQLYAIPTTNN